MALPHVKIACLHLLACSLLLAGCGGDGEKVIAEVNGSKLTLEDLYSEIPEEYFDLVTQEQRSEFVERWINAEVLYQEALRRGLQRDPATKEKFRAAEKNILITDLIQQELASRVQVSDEEAHQYYQEQADEFIRKTDEMRASQILVPTLEEANRIRQQIQEGADFSQLAQAHSVDPSAMQGGDLGYFAKEDVLSEVAKVVFSTPPGTLTNPIKTEFGYHTLLVTDFQKSGTLRPFELVKDDIVGLLSREKERQELELFLQELREGSFIKQAGDIFSADVPSQEHEAVSQPALSSY